MALPRWSAGGAVSSVQPAVVRVGPGRGLVIRRGDLVAVVEPADRGTIEQLAPEGLARAIEQAGPDAAFVAVASLRLGGASAATLQVRGGVTCTIGRAGTAGDVVRGVDGARTIDVPDDVVSIVLALDTAAGAADPHTDLGDGVVAGAVAEVVFASPEPATALTPPVAGLVPTPLPPPQPRVNLLADPLDAAEVRDPLPVAGGSDAPARQAVLVRGLACNVGHVNRLDATYCSSCGRRLQGTVNLVEGPRPSLGTLIFDDGTAYGLDGGYVVGRDPGGAAEVTAGTARTIALADPGRTLSRVHAEFRLDGWDVVLVDRGSANGTFLAEPGATEWTRVAPDTPVVLAGGSTVALGRRTLVFQQR